MTLQSNVKDNFGHKLTFTLFRKFRPHLMRYGIFSDVHSNLEALTAVLEAYKKEAIGQYLCVGDVVGYAANPNECCSLVKAIAAITIAGNHDWAVVGLFSPDYFNPLAKQAIFWTSAHLDEASRYFLESTRLVYKNEDLTLVHGTLKNPSDFDYMTDEHVAQESFAFLETAVCFIGHTHRPGVFIKDEQGRMHYQHVGSIEINLPNQYIVNVGSVGQPRDRNPKAAYAIYDTDKKEVTVKRIAYDIEATQKKIYEAGLPGFLGQRLIMGR
mgnify:CR=1 FL=1